MIKKLSLLALLTSFAVIISGCASTRDTQDTAEPLEVQSVGSDYDTAYPGYSTFDAGAFTKDQIEGKKIILFFWSEACAACDSLNADIISNVQNLPEDISIYRVEYEQHKDVAETYRVKTSDTVVMVHDKNNFSSMSGLRTLESILKSMGTKTISISSNKVE